MNTTRTSASPQIEEQKRECEKVIDEIVKRHTQACRQEAAPWIALRARLSTYDVVTVVLDSCEAVERPAAPTPPPAPTPDMVLKS